MSHTHATLLVTRRTFDEIRQKLEAAQYHHAFDGDVIDMHGIALQAESEKPSALKIALDEGLKKNESTFRE